MESLEKPANTKTDLSSLSDGALVQKALLLAREERNLLVILLEYFREIERRRLFSSFGYKSLFEMGVKYFGYSEDQCYRRISAMKILRELPQVKEKIRNENLNLTHLTIAQSLFTNEKKAYQEMTTQQKISTLELIADQPTREAERRVLALSHAPIKFKRDRAKTISEKQIELRFVASTELQNKIEILKGRFAHSNPSISLGELFEKLCDIAISQQKTVKKSAASRKRCVIDRRFENKEPNQELNSVEPKRRTDRIENERKNSNEPLKEQDSSKLSKSRIKLAVFKKANSRCENCGSHYALEIDHITPKALGGSSDIDNLRLLCRACNQRAAILVFGMKKMDPYLKK